ncbi:thioredoxin, partial [Candidatus Endoriftia persephone str. Guaymas]|nr:thioredoxin [Candidatus Endoriftia persephone str. Guaymas]
SLPTVKLFRNGQPLDEFMGALPEREIRTFLDRHIPRESDLILAQAEQLLQQGDSEGAGELMLKANQMDPDNPRVLLALGRYLTGQGRLDDAQALLNALPAEERESPEVIALLARIEFDQTCADAPAVEELKKRLEADPDDSKARFQLANHKVINNDLEGALEQFLILMQKDRQYNDDAGRKGMLKVFEMLGGEGELVKRYRNRMFNILH